MAKKSVSQARSEDDRRAPLVSTRARLSQAQAEALLRGYAERRAPKAAAEASGLSLNTVYSYYGHIRERLVACGYYTDGGLSLDESGLAPALKQELRNRRGIRKGEVYLHAAELIAWAEEWPPRLVLKHLRRIVALSGPLDAPIPLSPAQLERVLAYATYARTELINDRAEALAAEDDAWQPYLERTREAEERHWRAYRAASKKAERARL